MADLQTELSIPIDEFLRPFFDAGETVCVRIFEDRKTGTFQGMKLECKAGKMAAMEETLKKHNRMNRGIYFVVNFGGHEDAAITRINAQFVECDTLSLEEQLARIEAFPLPPSIIVKTRKSLHTYWLMKNAQVFESRRVQKALIEHFQGDPACVNESRVFRLPGFMHCKEEPLLVECICFHPERRYTQVQLLAVLPKQKPGNVGTPTNERIGTRKGLDLVLDRCLFLKHCSEQAATLSEADWYAMIANLSVFEGGREAIHRLSKGYPKYSVSETDAKIEHFLRSDTKPITCAKIAEAGFRCPKISENPCGCKSPAALCFRPLPIGALRDELQKYEIRKDITHNMQAAQSFVETYLYNIDPVIAEAFINHDLREHFGFKAGDMRTLLAMYREQHKRYAESKERRREQYDEELPAWYEPTERGGLRFLPGVLANHMAGHVEAIYSAGSYYFYENGVYATRDDLDAAAKTRTFMLPRYASMNAITDTAGQWRMLMKRPVREINCNPFIINVQNGLYNVLDGSFDPHTPAYYSTVQVSAKFDEQATCPQFLEFLSGILGDDDILLLQEIFGYFLVPLSKAQKAFVFVGAPNAGKSTLLSIVQEVLLGSENVSNIPWQSLGDRFKTAELFGKLANIFADLPSKSVDDNGMFKALTGEDFISAERKNKDPFSFRPYARLLFSCNEIPRNYGDRSDGFYRRLIIIRFTKPVPKERRDPNLKERLATERDGIFMWALEGLKRLMKNDYLFTETAQSKAELMRYKIESNSALLFVEECCEIEKAAVCPREELFLAYREYCIQNGLKAMSQANFNKDVELFNEEVSRGLEKISRRKIWTGIRLHK